MTVCHTLSAPLGTYTVEYDREGPWHSQWTVVFSRTTSRRVVLRRYFSYTEARRALAHITHPQEGCTP